jgi:hypothetical protein
MMHELTISQISELQLERGRPLVICDVDEVIVHFTRDYEDFLESQGLWLDTDQFAHNFAATKEKGSNLFVGHERTEKLVRQFFAERTRDMQDIEGAVVALQHIAQFAQVVMLTNLPHEAGDDRRDNLAGLGLTFPVITNSGPKGPAITRIAEQVSGPVVFIDDSPGFITSAFNHAPHVHLIHFLQDQRIARTVAPLEFVSLRSDSWAEVLPHVLNLIGAA